MSHMTRKEIQHLRAQLQLQCEKIEKHQGYELPYPVGLRTVDEEMGKCPEGAPSLTLRKLGQLLKHYVEELKRRPSAIVQFNVAAGDVQRGGDVQQAIRRARVAVRESVNQMEEEGFCAAAEHTALRVDRHDRILNDILNT